MADRTLFKIFKTKLTNPSSPPKSEVLPPVKADKGDEPPPVSPFNAESGDDAPPAKPPKAASGDEAPPAPPSTPDKTSKPGSPPKSPPANAGNCNSPLTSGPTIGMLAITLSNRSKRKTHQRFKSATI